jgi:phage protein D/phage baseplate assembly protein gpV
MLTGEITGIETDVEDRVTSTVVRGFDHSFKMMRHRRTAFYELRTATEIVTEIALEDGVMISPMDEAEKSTLRYKRITQPNISDWQFATELATRNGMFVDFDNLGLLRFRKIPKPNGAAINKLFPESPLTLKVGGNVVSCRTGITAADQVNTVSVRGWDLDTNKEVEGVGLAAPSLDLATPYQGRNLTIPTPMIDVKQNTYVETSTPYGSLAEVQETAKVILEDTSSVFAELEIVVSPGNPGLWPGETALLEGAGDGYDGKYTITSARHEFTRSGDYRTVVTASGRQVRSLYGLASRANPTSTRIHGVVNAIVENIDDETHQGMVKVLFPWLDDDYKTRWARTLQFGGDGGGVISPAVGDEVLVAFDRGDIDYPYVLGGLYGHLLNKPSEHDTPLTTAPGHLNRQSLVSRTGHRLELLNSETSDDGLPKHGVRLQTGDKTLMVFMNELTKEITINAKAEPAGNALAEITISRDGSISVNGKTKVSVTSDAEISIKAPKISLEGEVSIMGPATTIDSLKTSVTSASTSISGAATNISSAATNITGADTNLTGLAVSVNAALVMIKGSKAPYLPAPIPD